MVERAPDPFEALSRELLDRLAVEAARPPAAPGTQLVGGIVKAGAKLEALLRLLVKELADAESVSPGTMLPRSAGGAPLTVQRAMAGPLAHAVRDAYRRRPLDALPRRLRTLVADLVGSDSRILSFITVRNQIAKEDGDPHAAKAAIVRLNGLLEEHRRSAGWS